MNSGNPKTHLEDALTCAENCINLSEKTGILLNSNREHLLMSECNYGLENYKESLAHASKALKLSRKLGDSHAIADSYKIIGKNYLNLSNNEKAIIHLKKSLSQNKRLKRSDEIKSLLSEFGLQKIR